MLVLATVIGGKYYCPHFTTKAIKAQKLDNLPKVLLVNWQNQNANIVFTPNPVSHHHDIHPELRSHISYVPASPLSNCVVIFCLSKAQKITAT